MKTLIWLLPLIIIGCNEDIAAERQKSINDWDKQHTITTPNGKRGADTDCVEHVDCIQQINRICPKGYDIISDSIQRGNSSVRCEPNNGRM